MNPYRPTIKELQLSCIIPLFIYGMQQVSLGIEQLVCLKMMRDRHAQRLILVPSSKFVGYGSVDADDEAEGLEAPYINQSKWMDYATLEASHIPDIARYVEDDNLTDIKLKLTFSNSIAAMNIYMEQMKYHRATEQRAMVCMRRSFFNRT